MDPIRAYMLVIDGEPSLEDIHSTEEDASGVAWALHGAFASIEIVRVEIREVGDGKV
jgi:hypothetical protein